MSEPDNDRSVRVAVLRRIDEEMVDGADDVMSSLHIDHHQVSQAWNRALSYAVHTSPVRQFGIGVGVGWIFGYLFKRVSKTAAFLVGCSFLALQGASALGIINVNWNRLGRVARRRMGSVQRLAQSAGIASEQGETASEQIVKFCRRHMYITSGFASGAIVAITF